MENCYQILGVKPEASASEIRRAYRNKVKELHPDKTGDPATAEAFNRVVRAYEVLSDARSRSIFDSSFFTSFHAKRQSKDSFDYREWLLNRTDEESRSKLIFFDLMHNREDDAVAEFKRMSMNHSDFTLKKWFTREDFMDYGFILCEELVIRREYYDAIILLEQIIRMEYSYSYFRLFFPEVLSLARNIFRNHIEGCMNDELALDAWERALELGFSVQDDAFFLRKMGEAYRRLGDEHTAVICIREAERMLAG